MITNTIIIQLSFIHESKKLCRRCKDHKRAGSTRKTFLCRHFPIPGPAKGPLRGCSIEVWLRVWEGIKGLRQVNGPKRRQHTHTQNYLESDFFSPNTAIHNRQTYSKYTHTQTQRNAIAFYERTGKRSQHLHSPERMVISLANNISEWKRDGKTSLPSKAETVFNRAAGKVWSPV